MKPLLHPKQKDYEVFHFVNTCLCADPVLEDDAWLQNKEKIVKNKVLIPLGPDTLY